MLASDYAAALGASRAALAPSKGDLVHVFDWFRDRVLPGCCELMLTHRELLGLLGADPARWVGLVDPWVNAMAGGRCRGLNVDTLAGGASF